MENLIIKNNSGSENVGSDVLLKVYELALLTNGTLQLSGNIVVPHAKQSVLNYFENNFPDLHITLTGLKYIDFADPVVAWHVAKSYDPDGIGITLSDLNSINWLTTSMENNTSLVSFNELSQFINLHTIKKGAFCGCTSLSSIDLSNITTIEQEAFIGCTSLTSIDTSNVTTISNKAFYNCTSLTQIDLSSATYIGSSSFYGCTGLTSVSIPDSVVLNNEIRGGLEFSGCTGLTSVVLGSNRTLIPAGCFYGCTLLNSINLSNVTTICESSFYNCTSLTQIDLSNVTSLGNSAFDSCTSLGLNQTLDINLTNQMTYPSSAFNKTKYKKLIVHTPNTITTYDTRYPFFSNMGNLEYLDISDTSYSTVGSLYGLNNIITMVDPKTVTAIGYDHIGKQTIQYWILLAETPPTLENGFLTYMFKGNNGPNCYVYVKDSTVRLAYLNDSAWSLIANNDAANRIKTLSELPVGVWKTGLYLQYEPYLSNSSDPAYATT